MTRLSISDLLNPDDFRTKTPSPSDLVDIRQELNEVQHLMRSSGSVLVSPRTQQGIFRALEHLRAVSSRSISTAVDLSPGNFTTPNFSRSSTPFTVSPLRLTQPPSQNRIRHNVYINRKTTLTTLYVHPLNTNLEYPETAIGGVVGHLFTMDPSHWGNPTLSFTYSLGEPSGRSKSGAIVTCPLLVDINRPDIEVPCFERHSTCM
jgi:hypothetical protein